MHYSNTLNHVDRRITLHQRTSVSFDTARIPAFHDFLLEHGYRPLPGRSFTEYGRLHKGESLVVLYHSGAVLLQGADVETARKLFAPLVKG